MANATAVAGITIRIRSLDDHSHGRRVPIGLQRPPVAADISSEMGYDKHFKRACLSRDRLVGIHGQSRLLRPGVRIWLLTTVQMADDLLTNYQSPHPPAFGFLPKGTLPLRAC